MNEIDELVGEFPEDEMDYYVQLLSECHILGHQMINSADPVEKQKLTERYIKLQQWMNEIVFDNVWDD